MTLREEEFFANTNPLYWVFLIFMIVKEIVNNVFKYIGLNDWYFILVKLQKADENVKKNILLLYHYRGVKGFLLKKIAWSKAVDKIIKERL